MLEADTIAPNKDAPKSDYYHRNHIFTRNEKAIEMKPLFGLSQNCVLSVRINVENSGNLPDFVA